MTCLLVYSLLGVFPLRFLSSPTKTAKYAACYLLLSSLLLLVPDGIPHVSKEPLSKGHKFHPIAADSASPSCSFSRDGSCSDMDASRQEGRQPFSSLLSDNLAEIDPPVLDFGEHPIGQHTDRTVKIINHSQKHCLQLVSVSGTSSDFHPSFFRSDRVGPGEHTLFDVYFLPRDVGAVESTILIHTENGFTFPLPVSGQGTENPYHLRSLSARIPLNSTYSPVISLHNPHSTALQVTEMYSTAQDLHLELLSGASSTAWEVPPYQSKPVMRINFSADRFDQYTAFIRVKTSFDRETEARLIIPLEVEVLSPESLFSSEHELDFGLLRSSDASASLPLSLYNPSDSSLRITSLSLSNKAPFISLEQNIPSLLIEAGANLSVGSLRLAPGEVPEDVKFIRGSVRVNASSIGPSKHRPIHFSIPFTARIEHGHLNLPNPVLQSSRLPARPQTVSVWLSHTFRQSLAVYGAAISYPEGEGGYLSLHEHHWPLILAPRDRVVALSLRFMPNAPLILSHPYLLIYTNTSHFEVPIHIYSQQLLLAEGEDELEFDVVNPNISKTISIKLHNLNSDVITVHELVLRNDHLSLEKIVILPLLEEQLISTVGSTVPFVIQPNNGATLTFKLTHPCSGDVSSEVTLITDYQHLHIPFHYRSISGNLEAQRILFQPSFPGHVETRNIIVRNTFTQTVRVLDLRQLDPVDPRIYLLDQHDIDHIELTAFSSTHISKLAFDPLRGFPDKVYTGGFSELLAVEWMSSLDVGAEAPEVDTRLYERMQAVWRECQNEELTKARATFELDTDLLAGIKVEVEASLQWPSITPDAPIHFPLTLIGNFSTQSVPVLNPSDDPLVVQALLLHLYPDTQAALDIVDDWLDIPSSLPSHHSSFRLAEAPSSRPLDPGEPHPTSYHKEFDTSVSDLTWTYILPPRSLVNITVVFTPRDEEKTYSVILLRNNLTVIDAVVVHGAGAEGKFSLDGKMPESNEALYFNMTKESLAICNTSERMSHSPSFTRTLVARNQGQLDIHIESLSINGYPCQGYGFSIRQCKPFTLRPQSSIQIDITFTPDFTLYYLYRELILKTRHGQSLTFILYASVPADILPQCFAMAPRPPWQPYLPLIFIPILSVTLLVTVYFALQTRKDEAPVTPIPGIPSTYSREAKDKVFKLAAQFAFSEGEDEEVVKDKIERCNGLIKSITRMNKKKFPEPNREEYDRSDVVVPPIFLPAHRELVEIMRSSYDPDFPFALDEQDIGEVGVPKRAGLQEACSTETLQIHERALEPNKTLLEKSKHINSTRTTIAKSNSKDRTDHSTQSRYQVKSRQEEQVCKERRIRKEETISKEARQEETGFRGGKTRGKLDLKLNLPSTQSKVEIEPKNDSPVTSPSLECKKLSLMPQSNRGSKCKKPKVTQKTKVKIRKDKSKPDKTPFLKDLGMDLESQDGVTLLTGSVNSSTEADAMPEDVGEQIGNDISETSSSMSDDTKCDPDREKELVAAPLHTPPKAPLPIHKSFHPLNHARELKSTNTLDHANAEDTVQMPPSGANQIPPSVQSSTTKPLKHQDVSVPTHASLPQAESRTNFSVTSTEPSGMGEDTTMDYYSTGSNKPTDSLSQKPSKYFSSNKGQSAPKYNCPTKDTTKKLEKEKTVKDIQAPAKRAPFSGMSEELKHRIEEVCAPLTFDAPPLTGETHEQLSSILSTDAEPFIPDDTVLRKLLENSPMFQSEKKPMRKSRQQSGILDPQALAQLSLLLHNQSQCLSVSQDDYINLLATSLRMEPRILHLHLQYCWLCYQCNLIGLLGNSSHPNTTQASLGLPELLSQLQQQGKDTMPPTEPTEVRFSGAHGGAHMAQPSHHQTVMNEQQKALLPNIKPLNSCDVPSQQANSHTSGYNVRGVFKGSSMLHSDKNRYGACGGKRQKQPLGSFPHWKETKHIQEGKKQQSVNDIHHASVENPHVLESHDDSSFYERSVLFENLGQDPLSSSDPWRKEHKDKHWNRPEVKDEPHSLTESELLPTELMNSRPPSPQNMNRPREATAKTRSSSNEQPLIFLEKSIWSSKESGTEEDRLNSWDTITGKTSQPNKIGNQDRSYDPFSEKRWGQSQL